MIYAQFYHMSTGINKPKEPIEMCGSDGVAILDGRLRIENHILAARFKAFKLNDKLGKGIVGFKIMRGERFDSAKPISNYIEV
jgi:hypothetical protein